MRSSLLVSSTLVGLVRLAALGLAAATLLTFSSDSRAQGGATPSSALAPFVVKAADYDRHFVARAGGRVEILVTFNSGDAASETAAKNIARDLGSAGKIAGLAHDELVEPYAGAEALAAEIRATQTAILVVSTGLAGEIHSIAHELDGIDVLSVAVDPEDVARGIVLGLDTRGAKPKIVVRLTQARRQEVAFEASFLSLARIE